MLRTYKIVIAGFLTIDKWGKILYFEEIFMLANTSINIVLGIPFFALKNAGIKFDTESFTYKTYNAAEALLIVRRVKFINKHKFARATLNENSETLVVHIAAGKFLELAIHSA